MKTALRRRGRPRQNRITRDTGTPELVMKRLRGETAESLDLYLERGVISAEQHWCGIHLRWLYTLRFGAPGVRATDPTHLGGMEVKADDPTWRALREAEYNEAIGLLGRRCKHVLLNVSVYNERPGVQDTIYLREALDLLALHWRRLPCRA